MYSMTITIQGETYNTTKTVELKGVFGFPEAVRELQITPLECARAVLRLLENNADDSSIALRAACHNYIDDYYREKRASTRRRKASVPVKS